MIKEKKEFRINARLTKTDYEYLFNLSALTGYSISRLLSLIINYYKARS